MFQPWRKTPWADVHMHNNGNIAADFMNDVVNPSVLIVKDKLARLQNSEDMMDVFLVSDAEILLSSTTTAFCLALQSIWERQLRKYLSACAKEMKLSSNVVALAESHKWPKVLALFKIIKGVPIDHFEAYQELELLHYLGNICRHGNGTTSRNLETKHPNFWSSEYRMFSDAGSDLLVDGMSGGFSIFLQRLKIFSDSITSFWEECVYLYNESIYPKHESLEFKLVVERRLRTERRLARGLPLWIKN